MLHTALAAGRPRAALPNITPRAAAVLPRRWLRCSAVQHQQPLSNAERKARRAESQRLGKRLCTVNLGKAGVTDRFLSGLLDAVAANEYVKVRVGGGCDDDLDTLEAALAAAADCVVVHRIGFTMTLFRDRSLPRREAADAVAALAALGLWEADGAPGPAPSGAATAGEGAAAAAGSPARPEEGEEGDGEEGERGSGDDGEEDDSSDDDDPAADFVVVKGVRMRKPPEFTIIG